MVVNRIFSHTETGKTGWPIDEIVQDQKEVINEHGKANAPHILFIFEDVVLEMPKTRDSPLTHAPSVSATVSHFLPERPSLLAHPALPSQDCSSGTCLIHLASRSRHACDAPAPRRIAGRPPGGGRGNPFSEFLKRTEFQNFRISEFPFCPCSTYDVRISEFQNFRIYLW